MALDNRMNKSVFQKLGIPWLGWYAFRRGAAHISVARYEPQFRRRSGDSATRPRSKVLEKHYAAVTAKRAAQKRQVLAIGQKIDTAFAQRKAEQEALLISASQTRSTMLN